MNVEIKPHIAKLPIIDFPEINNKPHKMSISIPLFYSNFDAWNTKFTDDRMKNIHAKGAIWVALSVIYNTDLHDNGIPIYFHIEDKVYDYVIDIFNDFNVPKHMIRTITVNDTTTMVNSPKFGKKFICVDDNLETDSWLILDSDAFFCKPSGKFNFYEKLMLQQTKNIPCVFNKSITQYQKNNFNAWVWYICLGCGINMNYDMTDYDELLKLERQCYKKLELHFDPKFHIKRTSTHDQLMIIPKNITYIIF